MTEQHSKFCAECGFPFSLPNRSTHRCRHCGAWDLRSARILVACCVINGEGLLWIRRAIEPRRGFWSIPAGYLECSETLDQGAAREVLEETGIHVELADLKLHGLWSLPHINQVYCVFKASTGDTALKPGEEAIEVGFFNEAQAPWGDIAYPAMDYLIRLTYKDMRENRDGVYVVDHDSGRWTDHSAQPRG